MTRKSYLLLVLCSLVLALVLASGAPTSGKSLPASGPTISIISIQTESIVSLASFPPGWWATYKLQGTSTMDYPVIGLALLDSGAMRLIILQGTTPILAPDENFLEACYFPDEQACAPHNDP